MLLTTRYPIPELGREFQGKEIRLEPLQRGEWLLLMGRMAKRFGADLRGIDGSILHRDLAGIPRLLEFFTAYYAGELGERIRNKRVTLKDYLKQITKSKTLRATDAAQLAACADMMIGDLVSTYSAGRKKPLSQRLLVDMGVYALPVAWEGILSILPPSGRNRNQWGERVRERLDRAMALSLVLSGRWGGGSTPMEEWYLLHPALRERSKNKPFRHAEELYTRAAGYYRYRQEAGLPQRLEELGTYEKLGDTRSRAVTLGDIARLWAQKGDVEEALRLHQEELGTYEKLGDTASIAATLYHMAGPLLPRNQGAGRVALQKAYDLNHSLGHAIGEAHCLNMMAALLWQDQDYVRALLAAGRAWSMARRMGYAAGASFREEVRGMAAAVREGVGSKDASSTQGLTKAVRALLLAAAEAAEEHWPEARQAISESGEAEMPQVLQELERMLVAALGSENPGRVFWDQVGKRIAFSIVAGRPETGAEEALPSTPGALAALLRDEQASGRLIEYSRKLSMDRGRLVADLATGTMKEPVLFWLAALKLEETDDADLAAALEALTKAAGQILEGEPEPDTAIVILDGLARAAFACAPRGNRPLLDFLKMQRRHLDRYAETEAIRLLRQAVSQR